MIRALRASLTAAREDGELAHRALLALGLALVAARVLLVFGVLAGCLPKTPEKPACSPTTLRDLEIEYMADAVATCAPRKAEDCPEMAQVEARYRAKQEAWVSCR